MSKIAAELAAHVLPNGEVIEGLKKQIFNYRLTPVKLSALTTFVFCLHSFPSDY